MPPNRSSKRSLEELAQADDSNDEDYDDRAPGASRPKPSRSRRQPGAPPRKKQRKGYGGSDIESDSDAVASDDDSFDEDDEDEPPVEINEATGRPVRRAVKQAIRYEESSEEEDDDEPVITSEDEDEKPRRRQGKGTPKKPKNLIVTLKLTPRPSRSGLRNRSGSYSTKQPAGSSAAPPAANTRRSSRLSHDPEEHLVKLTDSGNHAEIVREGSRDPEGIPPRAMKGGKGLKYPSKSTIDEESQSQPKDEEVEEELEIKASQDELLESDPQQPEEPEEAPTEHIPQIFSDIYDAAATAPDVDSDGEFNPGPAGTQDDVAVAEPQATVENEDEDDDEVRPVRGRLTRGSSKRQAGTPELEPEPKRLRSLRTRDRAGASGSRRRKGVDETSDFAPDEQDADEHEMTSSGESNESPRKKTDEDEDYEGESQGRRSRRLRSQAASRQRSPEGSEDELAAEIEELKRDGRKSRRPKEAEIVFEPRGRRKGPKPNYNLLRNLQPLEEEEEAAPSPSARARKTGGGGGWNRPLLNTYGPFGGGGGPAPVLGGGPPRAQGGVDSDSSDDEAATRPRPVGGTVGMTPTTTGAFNLFPQPLNADPAQNTAGTPANLGKIKDKQALADADPLGVDQNVTFDGVGGLQGHIDQLKEMVALPLLYPEIFMRFKITPPRGVLFHGPPGTGKTLLARALATSVSSQGKKVTFYMRKGADALSKWVGEAERQLRLLFEEARKNQPSIIFFDEIDGLAPVRSSKQEQIHASIVSTLLALMDGMDGRGQVVVIGATNRPDSIDPALRRPGRFDREFYFPLPNTEARKAIIDIHTKGWDPPLPEDTKKELAEQTKGYGGADLRALCTEAALNAVQRRYPQIYSSDQKLAIDPKTIEVMPKDFMISVKKMTPSSERSASSGAAPLPPSVAPLLKNQLERIQQLLAEVLPQKKKLTALEEAQYEDAVDGGSFGRERMQQAFETSRVFRPRLLIHGKLGMGQQYVAAALLNHFEGLHVQALDIPTLFSDTTSSPEATVIRLFSEVKMHKPSVIYIPNIPEWYATVGPAVISTFMGLLRSIKPTDPVLLLAFAEGDYEDMEESVRREFFGYSQKNQFQLEGPSHAERADFFDHIKEYISATPDDFPDPKNRKKRELEKLDVAPPEPEKPKTPLSKEELKAQKRRDRQTLNLLKIRLQPIMDQIRTKYKIFRSGVIDETQYRYLSDEADPGTVTSDLNTDVLARATYRPFEIGKDAHGITGLVDQGNGNFYYNLDSVTIEKRLSNGFYKRPTDFLADIKRLAKDAKKIGDEPRLLKANELLANVEVDIATIETEPGLAAECEQVYQRELERENEAIEKAKQNQMPPPQFTNVPQDSGVTTTTDSGPIVLGVPLQRRSDIAQQLAPIAAQADSTDSIVTNGIHSSHDETQHLTNGSQSNEHEGDVEGDTHMEGTDSHPTSGNKSNETQPTHNSSSFGARNSAQTRPWQDYTAPSQQLLKQQGISAPPSQTGAFTPMPHGSQPGQFLNDASTTESVNETNKKTSPSQNTPQEPDSGPDLYPFDERRSAGGSQIPSTQGMDIPAFDGAGDGPDSPTRPWTEFKMSELFHLTRNTGQNSQSQPAAAGGRPSSSQGQVLEFNSQPSAAMPPPVETKPHRLSNASRIDDLLNPSASPQEAPTSSRPNLVQVEQLQLQNLHTEITDKTSGLSVEQLEQVNSVLMDTLWTTRGEWNRHKVMQQIAEAFSEVLRDMAGVGQDLGEMSWGRKG
ncbi:TAT-binding protein-like protein 7, AAA ATPase [Cladophialophora chaetospira]|uniref:TAT-binding protein-like protein 7, AAA ATPase n=1 Tax=Cladophialophora chaetospira TaxID=386627 RepID=A0AA38XLF9_9EURO|nr:TAT-binding protein-like protein 7, AAA ATPase [Cladophialophora chaetospira]